MSGQVEALAKVVWEFDKAASVHGIGFGETFAEEPVRDTYRAIARMLLASDWLRDHDRALRESIVADIEVNCSHFMAFYRGSPGACGYCETAAAVARGEQP